jgi:hypothetical protein
MRFAHSHPVFSPAVRTTNTGASLPDSSWQRASAQKVNIALVQNIYMYQMNLK